MPHPPRARQRTVSGRDALGLPVVPTGPAAPVPVVRLQAGPGSLGHARRAADRPQQLVALAVKLHDHAVDLGIPPSGCGLRKLPLRGFVQELDLAGIATGSPMGWRSSHAMSRSGFSSRSCACVAQATTLEAAVQSMRRRMLGAPSDR